MKRERIAKLLALEDADFKATVMGWVRTRRDSKGGFTFLEVNDGSCLNNLQVIANDTLPNYREEVLKLNVGSSIRVSGTILSSPGKGQKWEMQAEEIQVLGWADPEQW